MRTRGLLGNNSKGSLPETETFAGLCKVWIQLYWQLNIESVRDRVLQLTEGVIKQNDFIYSTYIDLKNRSESRSSCKLHCIAFNQQ